VKGNLIAATDGSALRGDRSSMAYCLAKKNGKKLYSAYSPILCDRDYNSSDRAELMAILAVVSHLWILSTSLKKMKKRSKPVELFSDSLSSIMSCEKDIFHSTKNVMSSNIDLKLEIRSILRKIKRPVIMTHVEAHQDEEVEYDDLPLPAQLNSDMDDLASHQYRHQIREHDELMPHLPAQKVSLVVHGNRLSHDIANEFIRVQRDYPGETAALRSWNIHKKYGSLIDWTALESSSKKWKKWEHGPAVKCIHRQWDTSARKKDWDQSQDDRCPICSTERETCDHVLQCEEKIIFEARKIFLRELKEQLRSLGTKPILLRWLMILTYQFVGKFKTKVPPKVKGYKKIRRAIQSQLKSGTGNILRGIISFKWGEIQARYDKRKDRTRGASWGGNTTRAFLTFSQNLWRHRCEVLHKLKSGTQDEGIRARCLTMALNLQSKPWRLLPSDQHLCARSLKFFTSAPIVNVKQWKRRCEVATELSSRKSVENGVDITSFFDRGRATRVGKLTDDEEMDEHGPSVNNEVSLMKQVLDGRKTHEIQRKSRKKIVYPEFSAPPPL